MINEINRNIKHDHRNFDVVVFRSFFYFDGFENKISVNSDLTFIYRETKFLTVYCIEHIKSSNFPSEWPSPASPPIHQHLSSGH